ncbi:MAG: HDIG domain-containing protein [Desulfobulbaceae bacterium]|nr:HDIG domain-containing protein [Desulfobulbaceae bacterium]
MVPTVAECFRLMDAYGMLDNVRAHSLLVARVAERLARDLAEQGEAVRVGVAVAGALLHDIAKTSCLASGGDHAADGEAICRRHGFDEIAGIVGEHVALAGEGDSHRCSEKEIVYYADKRVKHDVVVSLPERLAYILAHYGRNDPALHQAIRRNFDHCLRVEAKLFRGLPYRPEEMAALMEAMGPADEAWAPRWQGLCG